MFSIGNSIYLYIYARAPHLLKNVKNIFEIFINVIVEKNNIYHKYNKINLRKKYPNPCMLLEAKVMHMLRFLFRCWEDQGIFCAYILNEQLFEP